MVTPKGLLDPVAGVPLITPRLFTVEGAAGVQADTAHSLGRPRGRRDPSCVWFRPNTRVELGGMLLQPRGPSVPQQCSGCRLFRGTGASPGSTFQRSLVVSD